MVVIRRTSVRAASVPVGYDEPVLLNDSTMNAHRTRLISNAAIDDTDAMSNASKRNDQQLMRDINARLANASFAQPSPVITRRSSHRTPSYTNKPPLPASSVTSSLMMSHRPLLAHRAEDDTDVNHDVDLMMPLTTRELRGGSVPPIPLKGSAVLMGGHHPVVKTRVVKNGPVVVRLNGPGSFRSYHPVEHYATPGTHYVVQKPCLPESLYYYPASSAHLTPTADLAVRQAHRNLDRIEHELKTDSTLAPPPSSAPSIRTYATVDIGPRRRSSSFHGPITTMRHRSPSPVYPTFTATSVDLPSYTYSSTSVPAYRTNINLSYPLDTQVITTTTRRNVLQSEPDLYPTTLYRTRTLPSSTSRPLSGYGYVSSGATRIPTASTSLTDIDAIVQSARTLPDVPASSYRPASSGGDYKAVNTTKSPLPPIVRPHMSETRRRVRDVLCKVKGDPKYFD